VTDSEHEPDAALLARVGEVMSGVQSGAIDGVLCICFMANGTINVQVGGNQSLIVRLGALEVTRDAVKLLEHQQQAQRQAQAQWAPGGNA
jgi:hypothetical protein